MVGTFNIVEAARRSEVKHLLMASTRSVYGTLGRPDLASCKFVDAILDDRTGLTDISVKRITLE